MVDPSAPEWVEPDPRVVRERNRPALRDGVFTYKTSYDGDPCDVWYYEDIRVPSMLAGLAVGYELDEMETRVVTFDDMRPGCYEQKARLADMDIAGVEAFLCFPSKFARFAGQRFAFGKDTELSKVCVRAYNDFMLEEWCAGSGGRLIPLGILPLGTPRSAPPRCVRWHPVACMPCASPRSRPTSGCLRSTRRTGTRSSRSAQRRARCS